MFERKSKNRVVSSSRSGGAVHELVHDWSISGYDFIKGYQIERFNSPSFKFYGFEWFIQFYPHGTSDNRENVAVFLIGKDLPKVETLCSNIQFSVINQNDNTKTVRPRPYYYVLSGKDTKHNHSNSGGHVNVIKSQDLHDISKGFIGSDGTMKIRLELKVSCLDPNLCPHTVDARTGLCRLSQDSQSRTLAIQDESIAEQVGLVPSLRVMLNERICTDVELRVPRNPERHLNPTPCSSSSYTFPQMSESPDSPTATSTSPKSARRFSHSRRSNFHSRAQRRRNGAPFVHDSSVCFATSRRSMSIDSSSSSEELNMSVSSDGYASPPRVNTDSRRLSPRSTSGSELTADDRSSTSSCVKSLSPRLPSSHESGSRSSAVISRLSSLDDSDNESCSSATHYIRRAHKCILASRSPVFRAMFSLRMHENVRNEVDIEDLSPQVLDALLDYIYSDAQPALHLVPALLYAADKYQMPGLLHSCECILVRSLTTDNCLDALHFANQHALSCPNLRDNVMSFICENFSGVCQRSQFEKFMKTNTSLAHEVVCEVAQFVSNSSGVF